VDPAAEFPEPNDDQQARGAEPAALSSGRQDGSERKVTVSFTVAMKQSGPPRAIHEALRLVEASAGAGIGERILRWLRGHARPPITKTAQLPDPEDATARDASSRVPSVSFLAALDSAEREALAAVAVPQRFAVGETLMREGDQADHVMVIIKGRTEVCVDENGWKRTLAERGPGQLVGERAGLQVRMRSASVIALEAVRVLTVRTEDFQAFVNAHPKVFDIVEQQLYDRLTETPARYRDHRQPKTAEVRPDSTEPAAVPAGDRLIAGGATPSVLPLNGENCTILYSDVVGFSSLDRNDADRLVIRKALLDMTRLTLQDIPGAWSQDRGDGLLTVVPPSVPTADVIALLHRVLPSALDRHNRTDRESTRFRLRIAVDVGPVTSDAIGVNGEAIIIAARMLDAPIFKAAIAAGTANLGVIASRFVYDTAIRHSLNPLDRSAYSQVLVEVKELTIVAWMKLFTAPMTPVYFYQSVTPDSFGAQLAALALAVEGPLEQMLHPGQGFLKVGLGRGLAGVGQGQPAQRGVRVLGADRVGGLGGHEEPDVGVLVGGFSLARGDGDNDHLLDLGVWPRR
jgi:CRP-like cAMP-binding protein